MRVRRTETHVVRRARSDGLLIEHVGTEMVIYDMETKEAHCLKDLAAAVFENSDGSRTLSEVTALVRVYLGESIAETDVAAAVEQLEQAQLLEGTPLIDVANGTSPEAISRRTAMRRFAYGGAAAAFAAPLITSLVAPATAWASGCPAGSTCTKNTDCTSGHCCQNNPGKLCNVGCCVNSFNDCNCVNNVCTAVVAGVVQPPCNPCNSLCTSGGGVNCQC
jgi:hypothetical protein